MGFHVTCLPTEIMLVLTDTTEAALQKHKKEKRKKVLWWRMHLEALQIVFLV